VFGLECVEFCFHLHRNSGLFFVESAGGCFRARGLVFMRFLRDGINARLWAARAFGRIALGGLGKKTRKGLDGLKVKDLSEISAGNLWTEKWTTKPNRL